MKTKRLLNALLWAVLALVFVTRVVDAWTRGSTVLALAFVVGLVAAVVLAVRELRQARQDGEGKA